MVLNAVKSKQSAPGSQRVLLQEYLTNYEVPENPKQIYNGIDCLIMKVIKTHKYNFHWVHYSGHVIIYLIRVMQLGVRINFSE